MGSLADPGVYRADVPASAILAYFEGREEKECPVLLPASVKVMRVR
jgi:hypothetical protein